MKKSIWIVGLLLLLAFGVFGIVPAQIGLRYNEVLQQPPYVVPKPALVLHKDLFIADLHADSLLWDRNLLADGQWGHLDLPRMAAGNMALQAFTVVTKTPEGKNIERNDGNSDQIQKLAIVQLWPSRTWNSPLERALYQAKKLHTVQKNAGGAFHIIKNRTDLVSFLVDRNSEQAQRGSLLAGWLGLEGAHALEGNLQNLDKLYDAGFRMIGLAHFFDNEFAGSAHGVQKHGLTPMGEELIKTLEARRMMVDLSHASSTTINDVLKIAKRPVLVSHTGVKGTCNNNRNLSDAQLQAIAKNGGLIGIGIPPCAVKMRLLLHAPLPIPVS